MRIGIRKYKPNDAEEFQRAVLESVEHVSKWLPWCSKDYSIEDAEEWASGAQRSWEEGTDYRFIIEDQETKEILGAVGINQVVRQYMIGNLGFWVKASALNKGCCTQAAKLATEYAFKELGFNRIEIHVLTENKSSIAVAENLGGVFEGAFRNKIIFNGVPSPANCYSIIPSDYGIPAK